MARMLLRWTSGPGRPAQGTPALLMVAPGPAHNNLGTAMQFAIEVGNMVKQQVEFTFNQLLGRTVIRTNGREVKRSVRLFSEPLVDTHVVNLSDTERLEMRIEKRRRYLFVSQYLVYVNNRLVEVRHGV